MSTLAQKKIAFWGTPTFTTDFLDTLTAAGFSPTLIVTNPDKPSGRGLQVTPPAPKTWAMEHGVEVLQPEKIDAAFFERLQKESWDLFVVVAYGKILPEKVITLPEYGTINVHYSLLPKYRGATPVESAILRGDEKTGVVIQQMQFKLDTGPILAQTEIGIDPSDTTGTLREKLNQEALNLLPQTLTAIFEKTVTPHLQDETHASHCKKIQKEDGLVTLSDDPETLDRKFRAYYGWPGIYFDTVRREKALRVKITKAHLDESKHFIIEEVIPQNEKRMTWEQYSTWTTS